MMGTAPNTKAWRPAFALLPLPVDERIRLRRNVWLSAFSTSCICRNAFSLYVWL